MGKFAAGATASPVIPMVVAGRALLLTASVLVNRPVTASGAKVNVALHDEPIVKVPVQLVLERLNAGLPLAKAVLPNTTSPVPLLLKTIPRLVVEPVNCFPKANAPLTCRLGTGLVALPLKAILIAGKPLLFAITKAADLLEPAVNGA